MTQMHVTLYHTQHYIMYTHVTLCHIQYYITLYIQGVS